MSHPKISILVPCYNVEKYIRQCMDSIVNQTLKDIEIICINDGSKDNTLSILQEYAQKDDRITVIDKSNSGYGHSMNMGLDKASGEYIGIVESDDFADLNMFEELYELAKSNNVEVVKSDFYKYYSDKGDEKANTIPKDDAEHVIDPKEKSSIFYSQAAIWSAIYKRSFLNEKNIRFLETPGASYQDTSFNFKVLATANKMMLTKKAFIHYRQDNESSSVKSKDKVFCIVDEWNEIERFMEQYPEEKKRSVKLRNHLKIGNYLWNLERLDSENEEEFKKFLSRELTEILKNKGLKLSCYSQRTKLILQSLIDSHSVSFILKYSLFKISRLFIKSKFKNNQKIYSILFGVIKFKVKVPQPPVFNER